MEKHLIRIFLLNYGEIKKRLNNLRCVEDTSTTSLHVVLDELSKHKKNESKRT